MIDDVIAQYETPVQWRERMDRRRENEMAKHGRTNRIEALRAASRIAAQSVAACLANPEVPIPTSTAAGMTLELAEQFARWLETGER